MLCFMYMHVCLHAVVHSTALDHPPANYGCANKHNQWVVYDGKSTSELAAADQNPVVDLTLEEEMDAARRVAEALCAPATLA